MPKVDMERKLTPKQIKFCEAYIETGNASEAYRQAYDTSRMAYGTIRNMASQLLARDDIAVTIEGMQAKHREMHCVTIESMTENLREIRDAACKAGQFGAAASAAKTIAQIHGLLITRQEISGRNGGDMPIITLAESLARIAQLGEPELIDVTPEKLRAEK